MLAGDSPFGAESINNYILIAACIRHRVTQTRGLTTKKFLAKFVFSPANIMKFLYEMQGAKDLCPRRSMITYLSKVGAGISMPLDGSVTACRTVPIGNNNRSLDVVFVCLHIMQTFVNMR